MSQIAHSMVYHCKFPPLLKSFCLSMSKMCQSHNFPFILFGMLLSHILSDTNYTSEHSAKASSTVMFVTSRWGLQVAYKTQDQVESLLRTIQIYPLNHNQLWVTY